MKRSLTLLSLLFGILIAPLAAAPPRVVPPTPDPTLHVYRENASGGTVQVVAHEVPQSFVSAIREKLRGQARAYARGEYDDPAPTGSHPGATLRANSSKVVVTYTDVSAGGQIAFKSSDPKVVNALHSWFAEQVQEGHKKEPHGGPGDLPS